MIPVGIGALIGAFSGYHIGAAHHATGWNMAGYVLGGTLIGGASGGAALAAAGGGAMLAGAAAGAVGGGGFSGLAGNNVLTGAVNGALAGLVGGGVGSAIGGGWGALAGGTASNITGQLLSTGDVNWTQAGVSGALSFGMYQGMSYASYEWGGGNKLGGLDVTYRQFCKINAAYERSRFWGKEYGVYLNRDGSARFVPGNDRHKFDVTFNDWQKGDFATAHTHWAKPGVDWVDVGGTGSNWERYNPNASYSSGSYTVTTVGGYHSPGDMSIPGFSLVVGRTSSTYLIGGTGSYNYITPDPFVRFFMFPWW